jgi:hypothetical protein
MTFTFDAPWKDPNSTLDYSMDWSGWLDDGETITSQQVTADPAGLTVSNVSGASGVVRWRLAGGTVGTVYYVTVRVTTSVGQIDDRTVRIRIKDL